MKDWEIKIKIEWKKSFKNKTCYLYWAGRWEHTKTQKMYTEMKRKNVISFWIKKNDRCIYWIGWVCCIWVVQETKSMKLCTICLRYICINSRYIYSSIVYAKNSNVNNIWKVVLVDRLFVVLEWKKKLVFWWNFSVWTKKCVELNKNTKWKKHCFIWERYTWNSQ